MGKVTETTLDAGLTLEVELHVDSGGFVKLRNLTGRKIRVQVEVIGDAEKCPRCLPPPPPRGDCWRVDCPRYDKQRGRNRAQR